VSLTNLKSPRRLINPEDSQNKTSEGEERIRKNVDKGLDLKLRPINRTNASPSTYKQLLPVRRTRMNKPLLMSRPTCPLNPDGNETLKEQCECKTWLQTTLGLKESVERGSKCFRKKVLKAKKGSECQRDSQIECQLDS